MRVLSFLNMSGLLYRTRAEQNVHSKGRILVISNVFIPILPKCL